MVKYPGTQALTLLRAAGHVLAQRDHEDAAFYLSDLPGSVLGCLGRQMLSKPYMAYGYEIDSVGSSLLRFNGQRKEPATGNYLLGDGYRGFNPALMRFNGPDSVSPFGAGGVNAYCYCAGDPINKTDPSGHMLKWLFKAKPQSNIPRSDNPNVRVLRVVRRDPEYTPVELMQRMDKKLRSHDMTYRLPPDTIEEVFGYLGGDVVKQVKRLATAETLSEADRELVKFTRNVMENDAVYRISKLTGPSSSAELHLIVKIKNGMEMLDYLNDQNLRVRSVNP